MVAFHQAGISGPRSLLTGQAEGDICMCNAPFNTSSKHLFTLIILPLHNYRVLVCLDMLSYGCSSVVLLSLVFNLSTVSPMLVVLSTATRYAVNYVHA